MSHDKAVAESFFKNTHKNTHREGQENQRCPADTTCYG